MTKSPNALFRRLDDAIAMIDRLLAFIAALMMLATMVIVSADVLLRYLFNAPLSWSYDLIGLYLMAGIFFLLLSDTFRMGGHIGVDIVQQALPRAARHVMLGLGDILSIAVFGPIVWIGLNRTQASLEAGEVLAGLISWPVWVSYAFVPLGMGMLTLRLVLDAIGHFASAARGVDYVTLHDATTEAEAV